MKNRYRVIPDEFLGYGIQIKRWWFPVWVRVGSTYETLGEAKLKVEHWSKEPVYFTNERD